LDSQDRIAELVPLIEHETPKIFWKLFIDIWPTCDAAWEWQKVLAVLFRRVGPCPIEYLHADAGFKVDGEFFEEFWDLPEQLTLYRGSSRSRIKGAISWTTDEDIAKKFAHGHRGIRVSDPVIATATINKADIFAATNERSEREVLCLPRIVNVQAFVSPNN
jgi:hypothetical protein